MKIFAWALGLMVSLNLLAHHDHNNEYADLYDDRKDLLETVLIAYKDKSEVSGKWGEFGSFHGRHGPHRPDPRLIKIRLQLRTLYFRSRLYERTRTWRDYSDTLDNLIDEVMDKELTVEERLERVRREGWYALKDLSDLICDVTGDRRNINVLFDSIIKMDRVLKLTQRRGEFGPGRGRGGHRGPGRLRYLDRVEELLIQVYDNLGLHLREMRHHDESLEDALGIVELVYDKVHARRIGYEAILALVEDCVAVFRDTILKSGALERYLDQPRFHPRPRPRPEPEPEPRPRPRPEPKPDPKPKPKPNHGKCDSDVTATFTLKKGRSNGDGRTVSCPASLPVRIAGSESWTGSNDSRIKKACNQWVDKRRGSIKLRCKKNETSKDKRITMRIKCCQR